jgi:gamma-glutamyltranspeptidase/glutathione hydrolase
MRALSCLLALCSICLLPAQAQQRSHARSMVITQGGIAATSHTLASQAGAQVLARGGSAVDAAIAANAVLGVTEPMMNGIGGDLFVLYWDGKSRRLTGLNASGWAPRGLTIDFLRGKKMERMPGSGIHSVTVPGAVDGWKKMHDRYGRLPWKDLFHGAIHYAENGYPIPEIIQGLWGGSRPTDRVASNAEIRNIFLPGFKRPEVGDIFRNPALARTLVLIAERGAETFYRGEVAQAILKTSAALGGAMSAEDLAEFSSEWVEPISTEYRGWKVYELPPNGDGIAALIMLNLLERFQPAEGGPHVAPEIHKRIEAMKLAYRDIHAYVADPRFAKVPVEGLLSKQYAVKRADGIHPQAANCEALAGVPPASDTTYLTVVDRDGNMVSWIQSLYSGWGSGVVVDGMGFVLHNRGAGFVLDPAHPNALAPRKRPFHTIIPAFMEKDDVHIGFGIMGGMNQPLAHAQFVSNVADYGMNIQAALEAARFTRRTQGPGCDVVIESRVPPAVRQQLGKMGHKLTVTQEHAYAMGRGQAVLHNSRTKVNYGASDSRADGSAEPEPIPWPVAEARQNQPTTAP